jgi:hypothetical protein
MPILAFVCLVIDGILNGSKLMDKQNWKLSDKILTGSHMPVKPIRPVRVGTHTITKGHGKMRFSKLEKKAARKELNKERYGL